MNRNYKEKEIMKAFSIVEQIISDNNQVVDHFYSGDKDTRFEAMDSVLKKHGITNFNTLSVEEREKYSVKYSEELNEELIGLVTFRNLELTNGDISLKFIKKLRDLYIGYDSWSKLKPTLPTNNGVTIKNHDDDDDDLPF
jgi:hypothetical protein